MSEKFDICKSCEHSVLSAEKAPVCPACGGVLKRHIPTLRELVRKIPDEPRTTQTLRERFRNLED